MADLEALYFVNPDALLRMVGPAWVLSNPRLRTHVGLDAAAAQALVAAGAGGPESEAVWTSALEGGSGCDRTRRGLGQDGMHADHSGLAEADGLPSLGGAALFGLLKDRCLLLSNQESARARLRPLQNLFDRDSLGRFHQRVGQYVLLEKRVRAHWREWHDQKFSHDGSALLDNAYRLMQEPFFDGYFTKERLEGRRVLDFGCGNGYYTAKFAARGAQVLGLDNASELLEIARANHGAAPNLELALTRSFEEVLDLMAAKEAGSFDLVYLQDTLMLLLHPEFSEASPLLPVLFAGFRRLLRAGGSFCAMEPNPSYWLAGRYGDPAQPYAVVTEYRNPVFNVAPTLDRLLPVMAQAGFALKDLRHPGPPSALAHSGPTGGTAAQGGHAYQAEFPIWDFFVFVPA